MKRFVFEGNCAAVIRPPMRPQRRQKRLQRLSGTLRFGGIDFGVSRRNARSLTLSKRSVEFDQRRVAAGAGDIGIMARTVRGDSSSMLTPRR